MTAQEQQMLDDLTTRINQTQLSEKDPEAEQFLNSKLGRNPDALYIMAQTTLVQGYALEQAQKQLADAKAQLQQAQQQPRQSTSFLGNLFGSHDDPKPAPPQQGYQQVPNTPPAGSYYAQQGNYPPPPVPQYGAPQYGAPQYAPQQGGAFQQGGFLRSAMTTATGVAAGALAFEGIESLMHGFGGHSGGQGFGEFGGGGAPREEIVNNYYGDSGEHHGGGLGSDIEDRRGDSHNFADSNSGSDFSQRDDDSSGGAADYGADSISDDNSSSDDSGSNDSYDPGGNDDSF